MDLWTPWSPKLTTEGIWGKRGSKSAHDEREKKPTRMSPSLKYSSSRASTWGSMLQEELDSGLRQNDGLR